jgi:hypothetical protein
MPQITDEFAEKGESETWSLSEREADASDNTADEKTLDEADAVSQAEVAVETNSAWYDIVEPPLEVKEVPFEPSEPAEDLESAFSGAESKKNGKRVRNLSAAFGGHR